MIDSFNPSCNHQYCNTLTQGFLQDELVSEAHKGLRKRCIACSELLMQNTEKLDAIVSGKSNVLHYNKMKENLVSMIHCFVIIGYPSN